MWVLHSLLHLVYLSYHVFKETSSSITFFLLLSRLGSILLQVRLLINNNKDIQEKTVYKTIKLDNFLYNF